MSKKKHNKKSKSYYSKTYNNPHYSFKQTKSKDIEKIALQVFGSLYYSQN